MKKVTGRSDGPSRARRLDRWFGRGSLPVYERLRIIITAEPNSKIWTMTSGSQIKPPKLRSTTKKLIGRTINAASGASRPMATGANRTVTYGSKVTLSSQLDIAKV